ncbi:MAG: ACP S-malonyltransferase [Alphaproteobacteria bacterium]|nr:ACP S-malonyltransferase [Alphaproteobacteria bacterium]
MTKRALVIAPGRGTYNKEELGYLKKYHSDKPDFVQMVDEYRRSQDQITISELDGKDVYAIREHTRGDNASPLIYACAYGDFLSINQDKFDVVAITGNSMGWYIALGCGEALSEQNTTKLINTMGTMMQESMIGGQIIYPFVDENWHVIDGKREELAKIVEEINSIDGCVVETSIELGGFIVFGANTAGMKELQAHLPPIQDRFPLVLPNHAAFHTHLQEPISEKALEIFSPDMFEAPLIPLIDGRGHVWRPHATDNEELYEYTLDHQVCQYYDFTKVVQVAVKEYAPDCLIILGPGTTLGGAVAQCLIQIGWDGINSKEDFINRQKSDNPIIYAMGMEDQRKAVI